MAGIFGVGRRKNGNRRARKVPGTQGTIVSEEGENNACVFCFSLLLLLLLFFVFFRVVVVGKEGWWGRRDGVMLCYGVMGKGNVKSGEFRYHQNCCFGSCELM